MKKVCGGSGLEIWDRGDVVGVGDGDGGDEFGRLDCLGCYLIEVNWKGDGVTCELLQGCVEVEVGGEVVLRGA